jgi:deaminated glutathione amidase
VLHQSAGQEDMFPIEVDLSMVRRQRETGMKGLGQVLKSFRDRSTDFSVYDRTSGTDAYLNTLGPLEIPHQGTRAGLHVDVPAQLIPDAPTFKGQDATPSFAHEPLPNPTAGTATVPAEPHVAAVPAAAPPNPPVKPGAPAGSGPTSSG